MGSDGYIGLHTHTHTYVHTCVRTKLVGVCRKYVCVRVCHLFTARLHCFQVSGSECRVQKYNQLCITYTHAYTCIHTRTYIHTHTRTRMHTHTHAHTTIIHTLSGGVATSALTRPCLGMTDMQGMTAISCCHAAIKRCPKRVLHDSHTLAQEQW